MVVYHDIMLVHTLFSLQAKEVRILYAYCIPFSSQNSKKTFWDFKKDGKHFVPIYSLENKK